MTLNPDSFAYHLVQTPERTTAVLPIRGYMGIHRETGKIITSRSGRQIFDTVGDLFRVSRVPRGITVVKVKIKPVAFLQVEEGYDKKSYRPLRG